MEYKCACCGQVLPGDGISDCLIVSDMTSDGDALTLRFGRECGCASKILTRAKVAAREGAGLPLGRTVDAKRRR